MVETFNRVTVRHRSVVVVVDEVADVVGDVVVVEVVVVVEDEDEDEVEAVDVDVGAAEEAAEDPQMQDSGLGKSGLGKTPIYV